MKFLKSTAFLLLLLNPRLGSADDGKQDLKKGLEIVGPAMKKSQEVNKELWGKAEPHFKKSCDKKFSFGCHLLGAIQGDLGKINASISSFKKACNLGHKDSCQMATDREMKQLNKKAASEKISDAEAKKLCEWGATKKGVAIHAVCGKKFFDKRKNRLAKESQEAQQEINKKLTNLKKKYKEVIKVDASNGGVWELNQVLGDWVLFIARGYKYQIGVRKSSLHGSLSKGMFLHKLTNHIGLIGNESMKNLQGFPVIVHKYDALEI